MVLYEYTIRYDTIIGTCEASRFDSNSNRTYNGVSTRIRQLRIGNFRSNRISNRIKGTVVIYMFNADCHVGVVYVL